MQKPHCQPPTTLSLLPFLFLFFSSSLLSPLPSLFFHKNGFACKWSTVQPPTTVSLLSSLSSLLPFSLSFLLFLPRSRRLVLPVPKSPAGRPYTYGHRSLDAILDCLLDPSAFDAEEDAKAARQTELRLREFLCQARDAELRRGDELEA